jgi:hypothetical protein
MSKQLRVKLLTDGMYSFGADYIGQVLPAVGNNNNNNAGYDVKFPVALGNDDTPKTTWYYAPREVQVIDE